MAEAETEAKTEPKKPEQKSEPEEETLEGSVETRHNTTSTADDSDAEGDSDRPPTKQELAEWRQHQKDMGRTDTSSTLAPLENASAQDWLGSNQDPDVLLSVPNLGVDHIGLVVDNLRAHVELHAKVLDLLELHVGADASIEKVDLQIDNVRVQAMLKVKLENVVKIVDRVMTTIDNNPEILTNLTAGLGKGLEAGLGKEHATQLEEQPGRLKGVEKDEEVESSGDGQRQVESRKPEPESKPDPAPKQEKKQDDQEEGWEQSPDLDDSTIAEPPEPPESVGNDQSEDKPEEKSTSEPEPEKQPEPEPKPKAQAKPEPDADADDEDEDTDEDDA